MLNHTEFILITGILLTALRIATFNHSVPAYAKIFTEKGLASENLGDMTTAVQFYKKALRHDSKLPDPWFYLGEIYQERNDFTSALMCFQRITKIHPTERKFGLAYYEVGRNLLKEGYPAESIPFFNTSFNLDPYRPETFYLLAQAYLLTGDQESAQRKLDLLKGCGYASTQCRKKVEPWILELEGKLDEAK